MHSSQPCQGRKKLNVFQNPKMVNVLSLAIYTGEPFKQMARIDQTLRIWLGIQFRQRYGCIAHRKI